MKEIRRHVRLLKDRRIHAQLLRAYRETGNEKYVAAAKHLPLPLLNELQQRQRYLRTGRGQTVGKKARSRLYRMARMVMAGASMHEAAKHEVRAHGRGGHASDDAAVRYLRGRYAKRREDIEGLVAAMDQFLEQQREFDQQLTALADQLRSPALPALAAADEIRAQ